ncbi:MAG: hypothetical protein H7A35_03070 [Planctomycetales bacterium]|nr:hypothetical protein [bacterium]UNM09039.1 MAG: hypothetical protein H7A35_03070 [Planctomycetales bacterium]
MDQNMMILIGLAVAFSIVTFVIVIMRLPRRILLIWSVVEGLIPFLIVLWLFVLQPAA